MSETITEDNSNLCSCNGLFYQSPSRWGYDGYIDIQDNAFPLNNFFISGGNRLNFVGSKLEAALKFIIETLNDKEMHLKAMTGNIMSYTSVLRVRTE